MGAAVQSVMFGAISWYEHLIRGLHGSSQRTSESVRLDSGDDEEPAHRLGNMSQEELRDMLTRRRKFLLGWMDELVFWMEITYVGVRCKNMCVKLIWSCSLVHSNWMLVSCDLHRLRSSQKPSEQENGLVTFLPANLRYDVKSS